MQGSVIVHSHNPNDIGSESEDEYLSDSEGSESSGELVSSNIGVRYKVHKASSTLLFEDYSKAEEYEASRNKYFTPEIIRHSILVETHNHLKDISKDNFIVHFTDQSNNHTSGYGSFDNVIGFRLIKAGVPNRDYHITDSDKTFTLRKTSSGTTVSHEITLTPGSYTFESLGIHIQAKIATITSGITVSGDSNTLKYTFEITGSQTIQLQFNEISHIRKILGFRNSSTVQSNTITSEVLPDSSVHYLDIIIDEIPYIACKRNAHGNNIIDRIALYAANGSLNYYENKQLLHQNYFTPIKLSKLTIKVLDDLNRPYDANENDMFFEFEITVLNRQ